MRRRVELTGEATEPAFDESPRRAVDEALTTTGAVRLRLDLPVPGDPADSERSAGAEDNYCR